MQYDAGFFTETEAGSIRSAGVVLPPLIERFAIRTAVDVGCGRGAWASVLIEHGVDATGIDGAYIDLDALLIPRDRFLARDLSRSLGELRDGLTGRDPVDLAVCLEVAEHLPTELSDALVDYLTRLGRVVLFSAAIPNQGGVRHTNERPQSYWVEKFARRDFVCFDLVRPGIWSNREVEPWYAQNAFVFVPADEATRYGLGIVDRPRILDVVHPGLDERHTAGGREELRRALLLRNLLRQLPRSIRQAARVRVARLRGRLGYRH